MKRFLGLLIFLFVSSIVCKARLYTLTVAYSHNRKMLETLTIIKDNGLKTEKTLYSDTTHHFETFTEKGGDGTVCIWEIDGRGVVNSSYNNAFDKSKEL